MACYKLRLHLMHRSFTPVMLFAALVLGCGRSSQNDSTAHPLPTSDSGEELLPVVAQLNWYPEAEHGGLFQARADGTFAASGLDVEIRSGGNAAPVAPELLLGRCQFAITNADDVVLFRNQGADIVAVLAAVQDHPRCILVRADSGVNSFEDLAGKTLQCGARPFVEFMRSKGLLNDVREVPYHNSVAALVNDKDVVIQAYSFSEPLLAQQQGVEVRTLMVSDLGWNPYSSVLITSGDLIRSNPDLVERFVRATRLGWQNYLTDPTLGNQQILAANRHGMTPEALQFGGDGLQKLAMPNDMPIEQVGSMSYQRWQTLLQQMTDLKIIDPEKVKASDCFTTRFLQ